MGRMITHCYMQNILAGTPTEWEKKHSEKYKNNDSLEATDETHRFICCFRQIGSLYAIFFQCPAACVLP